VDLFVESHKTPPEEVVLDFDATDDPVHGGQEGRFFHGYYGHYCYLPLYVFAGDQLLCAYLRPSNIDESRHGRAILWLIARRLRQAWPDVRIVFRGDGGFCRHRLMRSCDRRGIQYVIGLPKNKVLNRLSAGLSADAEAIFTLTHQKQRLFGEFRYAAGTWDRQRRVIARIEHAEKGPNPRYVVTNLDQEKQALYDQTYCGRGEMENRIKEQQLGLFADRTSCHDLVANQFRLLLSSIAYVLVETLRRTALAGTELATAQATTIRLKLLKVGAVVRRSVRRLVVHLSESFPLRELFAALVVRLSG
jgi:hypothetical protein